MKYNLVEFLSRESQRAHTRSEHLLKGLWCKTRKKGIECGRMYIMEYHNERGTGGYEETEKEGEKECEGWEIILDLWAPLRSCR